MKRLVLVVFALMLATSLSWAQVSTFDLAGVVMDESEGVLPGATVTLTNENTGLTRTVVSNQAGRYVFFGVPPGPYSLRVELEGFATHTRSGLVYFANTKPILNVTLNLGTLEEAVTVTGESPLINIAQSQVGVSVEERQIMELPLVSRNYLDLVTIAGGVNAASSDVVLGAVGQNINGAYNRYTSYQLDGFNNNRDQHGVAKVDLGLDTVEEFRVITNQFSAEYGQSMAGIISAVTKVGGNTYHGSGFAFFRPGAWDAADPLTGKEKELDRQDVGFTFSGPIVKDKTHFFAGYEYRNQDENAVVTVSLPIEMTCTTCPVGENHSRFLAKVSHQFNELHRLEAKVFVNDETIVDGVGGLNIWENRRDNINDDRGFQAVWTSVGGANWVNEVRAGYIKEVYESAAPAQIESGAAVLVYPGRGTIGNTNRFQSANEDQWEISDMFSLFRGNHTLKTGFSFYKIDTIADLQINWDGEYDFSPTAPYPYDPNISASHPILYLQGWFAPGAPTVLERGESHIQVFFQDDWQVTPHFTLNLGARWEKETSVPDNNNFAPRLGFNWDATQDGRTSVRGGYGIFYSYIFSAIESFEIFNGPTGFFVAALVPTDPLFPEPFNVLPGPNVPPGVPVPPGNKYYNAPEFSPGRRKSPYAQHFTIGAERQVLQSVSLGVDVTYILSEDLIWPIDINSPSPFDYTTGTTRSASQADATRPFGVPGRPISAGETEFVEKDFPYGNYRDLYLLDSRGESKYWAVKVNLTKRYSDDFMLQGIYTWSRVRNGADSFRANYLPQNLHTLNDYDAEWGRADTDVPHTLMVNGIWDAPGDIRLSGIIRYRSGLAINPSVGTDLNGDRAFRERPYSGGRLLERNSFRAGDYATGDMSISKIFAVAGSHRIEGRFEIFNITNRLNPMAVSNTYGRDADNPLPQFLRVNSAFPGRQFQVSVRYSF